MGNGDSNYRFTTPSKWQTFRTNSSTLSRYKWRFFFFLKKKNLGHFLQVTTHFVTTCTYIKWWLEYFFYQVPIFVRHHLNGVQRILTIYEQAFGQQLNRTKTSLFFSSNTPSDIQQDIRNRYGTQVIRQHEKYLGLPSLVGRNKRNTFNDIKEKLSKKLVGWK